MTYCSEKHKSHDEHHHLVTHTGNHVIATGKKFTADEALAMRMGKVQKTSEGIAARNAAGITKPELEKAGREITSLVHDIFKSCKLEPEADAAIHPLLADILQGASLLVNGKYSEGHKKIHHAFMSYEKLFEHQHEAHSESN